MKTVCLFIDVNQFLHYLSLEQIDWCSELSADKVRILVAWSVFNELETLKYKDRLNKKMQDRAKSVAKRLSEYANKALPAPIRKGVEIDFSKDGLQANYTELELDKDSADDRLLAAIIEFRKRESNADVLLVAADGPLKLKARWRQIPFFSLADGQKLPDVTDANEKRIKELETQLGKHESAAPILQLSFEVGSQRSVFRIQPEQQLTQEYIDTTMAELKKAHPRRELAPENGNSDVSLEVDPEHGFVGDFCLKDLESYNNQLDKYYARHPQYVRALSEFENQERRTIKLCLRLQNTGGQPAEDIDIFMHFPDCFELLRLDELPQPPSKPKPPTAPQKYHEKLFGEPPELTALDNMSIASLLGHDSLRPAPQAAPNVSPPFITRSSGFEVEYHVQKAKHKRDELLYPLYVVFDSFNAAASFGIDYRISAGNWPSEFSGRLDVIIESVS